MKKILVCVLLGALLVLSGCGDGETSENLTPTPTMEPTEVPATPTTEPTKEPTEVPATPTTEPTAEPTAEPTQGATTGTQLILGEYKGLILNTVTQEAVEEEIASILSNFTEYSVAERAAENGDVVNINYVGTLDGVPFEGGTDDSEEGHDLELGSGSFIDGFEEGLIGAVAGEVRELELTFPEDYHNADMAGQTVIFTVTVNSVWETVLPELTDEFVSENLSAGMTVEEFRQTVRESLNEETLASQAWTQLIENSELVIYPEEEVEEEANAIIEYYLAYAEYYGSVLGADTETMLAFFGFESTQALEEYAYGYAEYMIKSALVMTAVALSEGIELTEEDYAERAMAYAIENGYTDLASFEADYGVAEIEEAILGDLVIEYIVSQAIIVDEN